MYFKLHALLHCRIQNTEYNLHLYHVIYLLEYICVVTGHSVLQEPGFQ